MYFQMSRSSCSELCQNIFFLLSSVFVLSVTRKTYEEGIEAATINQIKIPDNAGSQFVFLTVRARNEIKGDLEPAASTSIENHCI